MAVFYFPLVLIFLEIGASMFYHFEINVGLNGIHLMILFIILIPSLTHVRVYTWSYIVIVFIIYIGFRITYSVDIISLITRITNFSLLLFLIPISYYAVRQESDIRLLNRMSYLLILFYFIYTAVASVFKIGTNMYNTDVVFGLAHNQVDSVGLVIGLTPFIYRLNKLSFKQQIVFLIGLILIVLTLRRTPIILIAFGGLTYFIFNSGVSAKLKTLISIFTLTVILVFIFNSAGMELRLFAIDRYQPDLTTTEKIEEEGRYKDISVVWDFLNRSENTIIGTGSLFDSRGKYGLDKSQDNRPIHNNFGELLHGSGIIGVFLFISIIIQIFIKMRHGNSKGLKQRQVLIKSTLYFLIISIVVISLSGGIRSISASVLFIYIGALLRYQKLLDYESNFVMK